MRFKSNWVLAALLMLAFAFTRWPGLMPPNFSAAYALAFCAGVYFGGRLSWMLLGTLILSDLALNCYYHFVLGIDAFKATQLINYAAFAVIFSMGTRFRAQDSLAKLGGGGIVGALVFYLITNTAAWLFNPFQNPEYTKNLGGWIIALTKGTAGYPETWEFFRNTLTSGGLFTGLFAGAMKLGQAAEEAEAAQPEVETEEGAAGESKA